MNRFKHPLKRTLALILAVSLAVDPLAAMGSAPATSLYKEDRSIQAAREAVFQREALLLSERWFAHIVNPTKSLFNKTRRPQFDGWWGIRWTVPARRHAGDAGLIDGERRERFWPILPTFKFGQRLSAVVPGGGSKAATAKHAILLGAMESQFRKAGGVGDYVRDISNTMADNGHDIYVVTPQFDKHLPKGLKAQTTKTLQIPIDGGLIPVRVRQVEIKPHLTYFFVEDPDGVVFHRDHEQDEGLYHGADKLRGLVEAVVLSQAICLIPGAFGLHVDAIHANDWQTGLVPVYMKNNYWHLFGNTASLYISHNMAYKGEFDRTIDVPSNDPLLAKLGGRQAIHHRLPKHVEVNTHALLGLDRRLIESTHDGLEWWGRFALGKGFRFADRLVAVSEHNLEELMLPPEEGGQASGLEGLVRWMAAQGKVAAVFNGSDLLPDDNKDLMSDGYVPYTADDPELIEKKAQNKRALIKELNLDATEDDFIVGVVGRITDQKGPDLLARAIEKMAGRMDGYRKIRVVMLGSAEKDDLAGKAVEQELKRLQERFPHQVTFMNGFYAKLGTRMYAGLDAFIMPSRFEPAGISQQIANKFGTPVIAPLVGGLVDFFQKKHPFSNVSWGGVGWPLPRFIKGQEERAVDSIIQGIETAAQVYWTQRDQWNAMVRKAVQYNASWNLRTPIYETKVYGQAIDRVRRSPLPPTGASGLWKDWFGFTDLPWIGFAEGVLLLSLSTLILWGLLPQGPPHGVLSHLQAGFYGWIQASLGVAPHIASSLLIVLSIYLLYRVVRWAHFTRGVIQTNGRVIYRDKNLTRKAIGIVSTSFLFMPLIVHGLEVGGWQGALFILTSTLSGGLIHMMLNPDHLDKAAVIHSLKQSRMEVGLHTVTGKGAFKEVKPDLLVEFGQVLIGHDIMPAVDTLHVLRALRDRRRNQHAPIAFLVEGQIGKAEAAAQAGANVLMGPGFTPEIVSRLKEQFPDVVLIAEVAHDSKTPAEDVNQAIASGVDGLMFKTYEGWNQRFPDGDPLSYATLRKTYPDILMMVAGGVFETKVADVLARPEGLIAAVGMNSTTLETFKAQAQKYADITALLRGESLDVRKRVDALFEKNMPAVEALGMVDRETVSQNKSREHQHGVSSVVFIPEESPLAMQLRHFQQELERVLPGAFKMAEVLHMTVHGWSADQTQPVPEVVIGEADQQLREAVSKEDPFRVDFQGITVFPKGVFPVAKGYSAPLKGFDPSETDALQELRKHLGKNLIPVAGIFVAVPQREISFDEFLKYYELIQKFDATPLGPLQVDKVALVHHHNDYLDKGSFEVVAEYPLGRGGPGSEGKGPGEGSLLSWLRSRLERFKRPERVHASHLFESGA